MGVTQECVRKTKGPPFLAGAWEIPTGTFTDHSGSGAVDWHGRRTAVWECGSHLTRLQRFICQVANSVSWEAEDSLDAG